MVEKRTAPAGGLTPRALWARLQGPYRFWLDSADGAAGRYTYIAWGEPLWVFSGDNRVGSLVMAGSPSQWFSFDDPTEILRSLLAGLESNGKNFSGGALGYWGYECARYFEKIDLPAAQKTTPDFIWALPRHWAVFDHQSKTITRVEQRRRGETREGWKMKKDRPSPFPRPREIFSKALFQTNRSAFEKNVRRVLGYIAAGDIYQANLTHRMTLPWAGRPEIFFDALRGVNPSPYSALMEFPDFAVASCSPEILLRVRGDRVLTRPIAGTRPRGRSAAEDRRLSGELLLSPKERAEHVMLLDLERNDLGRVARPGSVKATERLVLEKYSHVTHIVSQVEGRLKRGRDGFDALKALFPGGTITGCPKIRCMEIIRELEREPRGVFYGSAGWIGPRGDMDMNILIRTALIADGTLSLRVGAGIVADSDPSREFEETIHKARALLAAYEKSLP